MRRSVVSTVHRAARRGLTWRPKQLGSAPLDIAQLISPLRYDVVVRAQFYAFLEESEHLPTSALVEAARHEPYRVWFERVAVPRFRPRDAARPHEIELGFDQRVLRSLSMLRSFRAGGFDDRRPITLRWVRGVPRTDSGVVVTPRLHLGDGGHRTALLLRTAGTLQPGQFQLDPRYQPAVLDNTAILARELNLSEAVYTRFVARAFTDQDVDTVAGLQSHLASTDPTRVCELQQLLRAHGRA